MSAQIDHVAFLGFQSLFSWNGRFHTLRRLRSFNWAEFQSLFSWNGRFHCFLCARQKTASAVSILVFLEWALSRDHEFSRWSGVLQVSILVFLEWALSHLHWHDGETLHQSFNPCFLGMGAFTRPKASKASGWKRVSILVFLEWALSLALLRFYLRF